MFVLRLFIAMLFLPTLACADQFISGGHLNRGSGGNATVQYNSITGRGTNPTISGFDINGQVNAVGRGAVASTTTETAATTSGSTSVTLSPAAGDFTNGQYIYIQHAGALPTISAPGAPTITQEGTAGSTSCTYRVSALDGLGGETAAGTATTVATCASTLTVHNYPYVTWTAVAGAVAYKLYGCSGASCTAVLVAGVPDNRYADMGIGLNTGTNLCTGTVPAQCNFLASASRDNLLTTISGGGATTNLVLGAAPSATGSFTMGHDAATPIVNALNTFSAGQGQVLLPRAGAIYPIPRTIFYNGFTAGATTTPGLMLVGQGKRASLLGAVDALNFAPIILMNNCRESGMRDVGMVGDSSFPPAVGIVSVQNQATGAAVTHALIEDSSFNNAGSSPANGLNDGIAFTIAAGSTDSNNELANIIGVDTFNLYGASVYIGHTNALSERIVLLNAASPIGIQAANGGSFDIAESWVNASSILFDIEDGTQQHQDLITAVGSETNTGIVLHTTAVSGINVKIANSDFKGGLPANSTTIDFNSVGGDFRMLHTFVQVGGTLNQTILFNDSGTNASITGSNMGQNVVTNNGKLQLRANQWGPGTVTIGGTGTVVQCGDTGGGFSSTACTGITAYDSAAANELGTIANAGTATCNFSHTQFCHFTFAATSPAITIANPTNLPTKAVVYIGATASDTSAATVTWGTNFYGWNGITGAAAQLSSDSAHNQFLLFTGNATPTAWLAFWSDGTTLYLIPGSGADASVRSLKLSSLFTISTGGAMVMPDGRQTANTPEMTMTFGSGHDTAIVANESLGTYLTVKPITIDNITEDVKESPTCTVSEVITCYDCGTAAGACTAGQTATISTTTTATGATRQSVAQTVTTANVAAAHYISCLRTAGACTVIDDAITFSYKMQ